MLVNVKAAKSQALEMLPQDVILSGLQYNLTRSICCSL